jgi:hypothetical protein
MIFGQDGEYKPRYGLWLDTSDECQHAVKGLLAEGWDCYVVLKWNCNEREIVLLSAYKARMDEAGQLEPLNYKDDYVREVFFPQKLNLRRTVVITVGPEDS